MEKYDTPDSPYVYQYETTESENDSVSNMIDVANLLCNGTKISYEVILNDIMPKLSSNNISATIQVMIARMLENPPKEPRMTKLASIMSALFPRVRNAVISAYKDNSNACEWTKCAEEALKASVVGEINDRTRRDIIQAIITDYVYVELGNQMDMQNWAESGGLR